MYYGNDVKYYQLINRGDGIVIKNYLRKVIVLPIIATSVLAINPIGASASWKQNNTGWWYTEGSLSATGWNKIDGKWYYFYQNGYMAKNTQINSYKIDSNGVAEEVPINYKYPSYEWKIKPETMKEGFNNYYYIENNKVIGEMVYKNSYLYYTENGQYFNGWKEFGGPDGHNWYYLEDGKRCIGWENIDGKWYYFRDTDSDSDANVEALSGKMVNTSLLAAGKSYEFDDYGVLQSTI